MAQLVMVYLETRALPVTPPEGYSVLGYDGSGEHTDGWIRACETLNGRLWTRREFEEKMLGDKRLSPDRIVLIADRNGRIAGTASGLLEDDLTGVLHMVGTAREFQGKRLAKPVCAAAVNRLLGAGAKKVILRTDGFRIPAIKTYLSLGFLPYLTAPEMKEQWETLLPDIGARGITAVDPDQNTVRIGETAQ